MSDELRPVADLEFEQRQTLLALLVDVVAELEVEAETLRGELHGFAAEMWAELGDLIITRDELRDALAAITEPEDRTDGEFEQVHADASREARAASSDAPAASAPDAELKELYRRVARAVHPDLGDDSEREERTNAMAAASSAFERRDVDALARLLQGANDTSGWRVDGGSTPLHDRLAVLNQRIRALRTAQMRLIDELHDLRGSDLAQLANEVIGDDDQRNWSEARQRLDAEILDFKARLAGRIPPRPVV